MTAVLIGAVVVLALALSAAGGYPITVWVLRRAERGAEGTTAEVERPESDLAGAASGPRRPSGPHPAQVLRGGTWIGILERLAITGAILAAYPAAIAVVIAVKGLGRFPELSAAGGVSERFIIGTLTSGLWAAGVGLAAAGVLNAIG